MHVLFWICRIYILVYRKHLMNIIIIFLAGSYIVHRIYDKGKYNATSKSFNKNYYRSFNFPMWQFPVLGSAVNWLSSLLHFIEAQVILFCPPLRVGNSFGKLIIYLILCSLYGSFRGIQPTLCLLSGIFSVECLPSCSH